MNALSTAAWLFISLAAVSDAGTPLCRVCDKPVLGKVFLAVDRARGGQFGVCADCVPLTTRCFACGLPVKSGFTTLPDGRLLCALCTRDAILPDEEAKKICLETRDDLDRHFARYFSFPQSNIVLSIVDRFTIESLSKSPDFDHTCPVAYGVIQSHRLDGGSAVHAINILSSLSKVEFEAVAAHEFGHAWINEHLPPERRAALSPDVIEAFCELIAYNLMVDRRAVYQQKVIKENPHTHGQFEDFLAAETRHGFNTVLDWMKSGDTDKLDAADPDGVRANRAAELLATPAAPPAYLSPAPPKPLPATLSLRSISGPPTRRLAIINNQTFAAMDQARVRLAMTNVLVRCLEIRTHSVLIRFENTGQTQELLLPPR